MAGASPGPFPSGERVVSIPERLLMVATRLFAENGFESTSVQEVVAAVHYFLSALHQIGTSYHPGGPLDAIAVSGHYVDLLLGGLRAPP
jgi:hypothetical protein